MRVKDSGGFMDLDKMKASKLSPLPQVLGRLSEGSRTLQGSCHFGYLWKTIHQLPVLLSL